MVIVLLVSIFVVQLLSCIQLFATPWTAVCQASLSLNLLKFMSIGSGMSSNHLILCLPFLFLPSIFPSIRAFSNELALCIRWSKYWSFNFSIRPSYEYSGLISLRIDWFDLLAVQGTLKSLLQNHSTKASILQSIFVYKAISRFRTILLGWIPKGRIAGSEGMNG